MGVSEDLGKRLGGRGGVLRERSVSAHDRRWGRMGCSFLSSEEFLSTWEALFC